MDSASQVQSNRQGFDWRKFFPDYPLISSSAIAQDGTPDHLIMAYGLLYADAEQVLKLIGHHNLLQKVKEHFSGPNYPSVVFEDSLVRDCLLFDLVQLFINVNVSAPWLSILSDQVALSKISYSQDDFILANSDLSPILINIHKLNSFCSRLSYADGRKELERQRHFIRGEFKRLAENPNVLREIAGVPGGLKMLAAMSEFSSINLESERPVLLFFGDELRPVMLGKRINRKNFLRRNFCFRAYNWLGRSNDAALLLSVLDNVLFNQSDPWNFGKTASEPLSRQAWNYLSTFNKSPDALIVESFTRTWDYIYNVARSQFPELCPSRESSPNPAEIPGC